MLGNIPIKLKGFAFNTEGNLPKELLRRTSAQVSFGVLLILGRRTQAKRKRTRLGLKKFRFTSIGLRCLTLEFQSWHKEEVTIINKKS